MVKSKYIYEDKMLDDTLKGVSQIYSKYISGSAEKERVAWFDIGWNTGKYIEQRITNQWETAYR